MTRRISAARRACASLVPLGVGVGAGCGGGDEAPGPVGAGADKRGVGFVGSLGLSVTGSGLGGRTAGMWTVRAWLGSMLMPRHRRNRFASTETGPWWGVSSRKAFQPPHVWPCFWLSPCQCRVWLYSSLRAKKAPLRYADMVA